MKKEKIAIVGASIAGGALAIMLDRADYDITIFEQQAKNSMVDRGAGIALPKDLVEELIRRDMFDKDFPTINVDKRLFYFCDPDKDEERLLTIKPFMASSVHWCSVYMNLVKRLPDNKMHHGTKIKEVTLGKKVKLKYNESEEDEFDIVFFSDGFHSLGRAALFPESKLQYTNYIAWRGTEAKINAYTNEKLKNVVPFYLFEKGHLLIFKIPILHTKNPAQEYLVNWLVYEKMDANHPFVRDRKSQDNIPPPAMTEEYIDYLHKLAKKYFSSFARDVVLQTPKPFTQAIHDAWVPAYFSNNVVLLGDSSILLRPHVGAGSTKALLDVLSLEEYLKKGSDIYSALAAWSIERQKVSNKLYHLCRDLGKLLVSDVPDWKNVDTPMMNNYWDKIVADHKDWYQIIEK